MKKYLKITNGTRVPLFAVGLLFLSIVIVSCGGGYGGGGGGGGGMLGSFSLSMPANGATGVSLTPTLTWTASAGANSYTVQIKESSVMNYSGFPSVTGTSLTVTTSLAANTMYDWQVMADGIYGTITAGPFSFMTGTM